MVKIFSFYISALLLYALNLGFFANFPVFGALPNLLLLMVLYAALEEQGEFYLLFSFFWGLLLDFSTALVPGTFAFTFLVTALLLRRFATQVVSFEKNWKFLPLVLVACEAFIFLWMFMYNWLLVKFGQPGAIFVKKELLERFIWESLYTLVFVYPLWKLGVLIDRFSARFSPRPK